jgi:hypothetical protein
MKHIALLVSFLLAAAAGAQTLKVDPAASPAGAGSSQANWSVTQDGKPLLSWVEPAKDGSFALRYSSWTGTAWS